MKKLYFVITFILINFASFSQNPQYSQVPLYSDTLLIGTWALNKVVWFSKSETPSPPSGMMVMFNEEPDHTDLDIPISNPQPDKHQTNTNKSRFDIPTDSMIQVAIKFKREIEAENINKFQESLTPTDSIIYQNNLLKDSTITLVIRSDKSFSLGSKYNVQIGQWQLDNTVLVTYETGQADWNDILYLDKNHFILQKIKDPKVTKMYFEKK